MEAPKEKNERMKTKMQKQANALKHREESNKRKLHNLLTESPEKSDRENFHDEHFMEKLVQKIQKKNLKNRKSEVVNLNQVPRESQYAFKDSELDEFGDSAFASPKNAKKRAPRACVDQRYLNDLRSKETNTELRANKKQA